MSAEHTPFERASRSGLSYTDHSPDGFQIIREFSNGQRFLLSPSIGFPVELSLGEPFEQDETPEGRYEREVCGDEWHTPMSL